MRKATEAPNDFRVTLRPLEWRSEAVVAQARKELDRVRLRFDRFGVLERHVKKPAFDRNELAIIAARHRILRGRERSRIAGKGPRRAAVDVARELVEQDHARKLAARRCPVAEASRDRGFDGAPELRAH